MLLGASSFFILAVNNGWIAGQRVACGSLASGIVFLAGLWTGAASARRTRRFAAVGSDIRHEGGVRNARGSDGALRLILEAVCARRRGRTLRGAGLAVCARDGARS